MPDLEGRMPAARSVALCRVLPMAPAMVGSAAVMLVLLGWAGEWTGVLLLGWVLIGLALTSRLGERLVVWWCRGYRATPAQGDLIDGPWRAALRRCDFDLRRFDLYVRPGRKPNAYSLGRRSVVVTDGLLKLLIAGRLTPAMAQAVLLHEIGHHVTGATTGGVLTGWLAAPWRIASRFALGFVSGGRLGPRGLRAVVAITVLGTAVVQAVEDGKLGNASLLCALPLLSLTVPLVDGAVSRRCERVADQYAVDAGLGDELRAALHVIEPIGLRRASVAARLNARHPPIRTRTQPPAGGQCVSASLSRG
jgi:Zn-dependent protease with chaperone function